MGGLLPMQSHDGASPKRKLIVIVVMLTIALAHVIGFGRFLSGQLRVLYVSYFSDLVLPFGFYLLLTLVEDKHRLLRAWWAKAVIVFGLATAAELLQLLGVYALGRTFDPIDIAAYAVGVLCAVGVERAILMKTSLPATTDSR